MGIFQVTALQLRQIGPVGVRREVGKGVQEQRAVRHGKSVNEGANSSSHARGHPVSTLSVLRRPPPGNPLPTAFLGDIPVTQSQRYKLE